MQLQYLFRTLLLSLSLFICFGLQAQTYTSGDITATPSPTMIHDSISCMSSCTLTINLTIQNSFAGDSVIVRDTTIGSIPVILYNTAGANPWVVSVPPWNYLVQYPDYAISGGIISFTYPDIKVINGTDSLWIPSPTYSLAVTNPCNYGSVSGDVYIDNDGDCNYSSGDELINNVTMYVSCSLSSPGYPVWGSTTWFGYPVSPLYTINNIQESWMTSYTVALDPVFSFIFPPSTCSTGPYTFTTLPQTNVNFPLRCSGNIDIQCYAGAPARVRPVIPFYMQPTVSNIGCDSVSGQLVLVKDNRVFYDASLSTNPATYVSGDTLIWNYTDLTSLIAGGYWNSFMSDIHLTPISTVNTGDTLCFRIYTGVPAGDINAANNDYTICIPVVNSYDPNIKEVSPQGIGAQGYIPASTPELTYTVHFQNTGSAEAINISVIDTLDGNVTPSSLKILTTSHTMTPEWLAPNVVKFNFNYIMLPDSTSNEPLSHGYVRFKVNMHSGLAPGTQIKNTAYIYFDSNPAVVTNTALNTIANVSAVPKTNTQTYIKIYPNPATDKVYIENLQGGTVSICSVSGTQLIEQAITSDKEVIDISSLPMGMYMIRMVNGATTSIRKLVKQ